MKATVIIGESRCDICGSYLFVDHARTGDGNEYFHSEEGRESTKQCPNAGKRYKHPTIELEEIQPS